MIGSEPVEAFTTPDLSDAHLAAQHLGFQFRAFGTRERFAGPVSTVACHADNSRVAEAVAEPGEGRVLLVDGQGALHRSLLGDRLAQLASDNGWAGVVVVGAIRDVEVIDAIDTMSVVVEIVDEGPGMPRGSVRRGLKISEALSDDLYVRPNHPTGTIVGLVFKEGPGA